MNSSIILVDAGSRNALKELFLPNFRGLAPAAGDAPSTAVQGGLLQRAFGLGAGSRLSSTVFIVPPKLFINRQRRPGGL